MPSRSDFARGAATLLLATLPVIAAAEITLYDAAGFEPPVYRLGDRSDAALIGQEGWIAFPAGGIDKLIVSRNAAIEGAGSLRSLSAKKSAAAIPLAFEPTGESTDLVVRFTVGIEGNDHGNAAVGLASGVDAMDFRSVHRVGKQNVFKTKASPRPGVAEANQVHSAPGGDTGPHEVELVVRSVPGPDNDRAGVFHRLRGEEGWSTLPVRAAHTADAEGLVDLGRDVPAEGLLLFVAADGKNFRRAPRIDGLPVVIRPPSAAPGRELAPPGDHSPPEAAAGAPVAPEAMPVSDGRWPEDAGVVDVRQPRFGAAGDGTTDDTAAIQRALDAVGGENRIVYLPAGTYLVSDTLRWGSGGKGREQKRTALLGAGRDRTVIRLADRAPGFGTRSQPKAMVWTGDAPAQRFRNRIGNLTLNTGSKNPGTAALRFNTSNQGAVDRVTIRSGDGTGTCGLDLAYTREVGNALFRDLVIEGFEVGVRTRDRVNGVFFENLTLTGQSRVGFENRQQTACILGLSARDLPAVVTNADGGSVAIFGATLDAGQARGRTAIENLGGSLFVRGVKTTGFSRAVDNPGGPAEAPSGASVDAFASHPIEPLFEVAAPTPLAIVAAPTVDPGVDGGWTSPLEHGAVGDGKTDDSAALQAAIDSGAATVYLPAGATFRLDGAVEVRGVVRRFTSTGGTLTGAGTLAVGEGDPPAVLVDNVEWGYGASQAELVHATSRPLVIEHVMLPRIVARGTGELFVNDASNHKWRKNEPALLTVEAGAGVVRCRNLNPENHEGPKIENLGGTLWIFGLKTENHNSLLFSRGGAVTEVLGGSVYAQNRAKTRPAFLVDRSALTLAGVRQYSWKPTLFEDVVQATGPAGTRTLHRDATAPNGAVAFFAVDTR